MMAQRVALYPGSFDCLTHGHLDLVKRGADLFDRLIVAVAENSRKNPFFTLEERRAMAAECTRNFENVEVRILEGLTIHFAEKVGARFIMRGMRAVSDFEFEFQMAIMNHEMNDRVETIFMPPAPEYIFLSSSMVKEVWRLGGDMSNYVPKIVLDAMDAKGLKN